MDLAVWREYKSASDPESKKRLADHLVKENWPLITKLVGQLSRRGKPGWQRGLDKTREAPETAEMQTDLSAKRREVTEMADLMQAGAIGFVRALDGYNPEKGGIAAYAKHWIRHELQQTAIHDTTIYLPKGIGLPKQLYEKVEQIRAREGREPTAEEIGISQAKYDAWRSIPGIVGSLQDVTTATSAKKGEVNKTKDEVDCLDFESITLDQALTPEQAYSDAESQQCAIELMESVLTESEREVIRLLVIEETPIGAVAKRLGHSVDHVTGVRNRALAKMREELDDA